MVKGVSFTSITASASPATVCVGGSSQLNVTASLPACGTYYSVASTTYGTLPTTGFTTVTDSQMITSGPFTIPFSFNFFGTAQTSFYVGSNGYITFGAGSGDRFSQVYPNTTAPNNMIALSYCDFVAIFWWYNQLRCSWNCSKPLSWLSTGQVHHTITLVARQVD